jgi:hypothetical protein
VLDVAGKKLAPLARVHGLTVRRACERLAELGAAHHADHAPDEMIVHRSFLARAPDEAHDRKALQRIAVEQILLIVLRMRLRARVGKPIIDAHQRAEQLAAALEHCRFVMRGSVGEAREIGNELAEPCVVFHGRMLAVPESIY